MSETRGESPQEDQQRPRAVETESLAVTAIYNETKGVHTRHNGDPEFAEVFRANTEKDLADLKALLDNNVPPEIIAEIFATKRTEVEMQKREAVRESREDKLTGLPNRRGMEIILDQIEDHARRHEEPLTYVMVDGDRFKRVNDTLGHDAGDVVLKGMANILTKTLRAEDVAARFGGEEFLVALPNLDVEGAKPVIERVKAAMRDELIARLTHPSRGPENVEAAQAAIEQEVLALTASFGLADGLATDRKTAIKNADLALYAAKERGRNQAVAYGELQPTEVDSGEIHLAEIQRAEAEEQARRANENAALPPSRWVGEGYSEPQQSE